MADEPPANLEKALAQFAYLLTVQIPDEATAVRELKRIRNDFRMDPLTASLGLTLTRGAPKGPRKPTIREALPLTVAVDYYGQKPSEVLKVLDRVDRATLRSNQEWLRRRLKLGRQMVRSAYEENPYLASERDTARNLPPSERKARALRLLQGLRKAKLF